MTNPRRIGVDLGEQKVLADVAEYGWQLLRLVELFGRIQKRPARNTRPHVGICCRHQLQCFRARHRRVRRAGPTATLRHPASLRPSLHVRVQSFGPLTRFYISSKKHPTSPFRILCQRALESVATSVWQGVPT